MFRAKMRGVSPAGQPCSKEHERALRAIKRRQDKLSADRVTAVKRAAADGASSYAIADAVGLSHTHVQRIVRGDYDKLLSPEDGS